MKKIFKWIGIVILVPILLFVTLAILIYIPPVQNWIVKQVTSYASEKTGMEISVEHVSLAFPLDLSIEGFKAIKQNDSIPQVKDTVANVRRLIADVRMLPLFRQQVEIDALEFNGLQINTTDFIHEARIKGNVGLLSVQSHGIDIGKEKLRIDDAKLKDANVTVELSDTVPPDTTKSENYWKIDVDKLSVENTGVTVHMPGDTLQIWAYMGNISASGGFFDLYEGLYRIKRFDWNNGALKYDNNFETRTQGLDYNHISLTDINIGIDTLFYHAPKLTMALRSCSFKEKSGIEVRELSGPIALDSSRINIPALHLNTSESSLSANVSMDFNAFDDKNPGKIKVSADGSFGKQDIMQFMGGMPAGFIRQWPNYPLTIKTAMNGNLKHIDIAGLNVNLPTAFKLTAKGFADNITDTDNLKADIDIDASTYNINFLTALAAGAMDDIRIPSGIGIKGNIKANGNNGYSASLMAREGAGLLKAKGSFNAKAMQYEADMEASNLQIQHFMPKSGMRDFTGNIYIKGKGADFTSTSTKLEADAKIVKFNFGQYNLGNIKANARIDKGVAHADIDSDNRLVRGIISFDALINPKKLQATVFADLHHADLKGLDIVKRPMSVALCGHVDLLSDMKKLYSIQGTVGDLTVRDSLKVFRPDEIKMNVFTSADTTRAYVDCGDFHLKMNAGGGYEALINKSNKFADGLMTQLKNKHIEHKALRRMLPSAKINLTTGKENPFSRMLAYFGLTFKDAVIDMTSCPYSGLNGKMQITELRTDSMLLDTIRFAVESDSARCNYKCQIRNGKNNPQYVFNALLDGYIHEKAAGLNIKYYDAENRLGVKLGAKATLETDGIRLHMLTDNTVLGYKTFDVNEDNYIFMGRDRRISAKLNLIAEDKTGVQIYTDDENAEALQDITVSLNRFDLDKIMSVIPYMPHVTGMMNGDFHMIQTTDQLSVSSTLSVDDMTYEGCPMGDIATEFVYMPKEDGSHYVDGMLMNNGKEVGNIVGTYSSENNGSLDARMEMKRLPLSLANGFIPDRIIGFKGYADGSVEIKGALDKPQVNGEVFLDSSYLVSVPYGVELRFSNDPVRIVGSHLLLENFEMFSYNNNPLNLYGDIDFSDLGNMRMNLRMRAQNYQIINSKEQLNSIAFGKAFVDFFGMISGPMDNLRMRGKLDVLGSTDMAYILRDSPLSNDNRLEELVKFTNFNDTTQTTVSRPTLSGLDVDLTIGIASGAHIICYINADQSNYVDLTGGGNLRLQYNPTDNIMLTGRYTLDNGEMKYSLPVIPLKTFTIKDGSYIEFTGDPMNPRLNITATERTKASVSNDGGQGRTVEFDSGVIITRTLSDMGLEFTIDAPEDMSLHNELAAMSVEQRGKLAVTMLTTGMYLADGNTGSFSMNNALSSFLEGEINQITGNALRTLDLSVGMDNTTDAGGNMHTDYSFKFAKRFWNNRLKIVVGGKVSTGPDVMNQNNSFFDNVVFEYRLDNTANKYVKLFYDNNAYDWLEGTTREFGVGFIWRRNLQHFRDIIKFKKDKEPVLAPKDTTKIKRNEKDK